MTGRSGSTGSTLEWSAEAAESVPGYRDLVRIGHGGFSVVYRAVQESFERAVAVKVLTVVGPDEDARRRFQREVRLAGRLSGHPHVVTVLDTGTAASGRPFLAMDLYDGGSMKERLARGGPLGPAEAAAVGAKIAEALAAAHAVGVLHRDVKPANILISRFGEPALADFGVSCLLDSDSSGSVLDVFSPQHAAPELLTRGVPSVSSDVYALGSTLYQLLTGHSPFGGPGMDVRSALWRTVNEPAPRPECPGLPGLADAIERALAKEPGERFPDAARFAQALRALIPDGAPSTLVMPHPASLGEGSVESAHSADMTDAIYVYSTVADDAEYSDETMVRPDRADSARSPVPATGGRRGRPGGGRDGARRARKPLILVAAVGLLVAAAWAVIASQGSSTAAHDAATLPQAPTTASARATPAPSPTHPSPSASSTPTHKTTTAVPTHAASSSVASAGAPPTSATSSSGALQLLPGTYHRFQNAQSGDCLAQPAGSATTAHQGCAASQAEGWESSVPLSGILGVVTGESELVNEQSGDCLTAGSGGQVGAQACTGASTQLWSRAGGTGSAVEFKDAGDGLCLRVAQAAIAEGPCGVSDKADLWTEDGTV